MPSRGNGFALCTASAAVAAHDVRIADAASVANAIEELQDLDGALAAEADGVAVLPRLDVPCSRASAAEVGELVDAARGRRRDRAPPVARAPA